MSVYTDKNLRITTADLDIAISVVDRSGVAPWAMVRHAEKLGNYIGGQKAEFHFRALLIGMVLVGMVGKPMFERNIVRALNALNPVQRNLADCPPQVTERMVSRRFNLLAELCDPSPWTERNRKTRATMSEEEWEAHSEQREARLSFVINALVAASIPDEFATSGSYAVDATGIASWSRQRKSWKNKNTATDPDADWRAHSSSVVAHGGKKLDELGNPTSMGFSGKAWYGFWMHALVRIDEMTVRKDKDATIDYTETPAFIESIEVTSAKTNMAADAARMLARMEARHSEPENPAPKGDIVMDRAYSLGYETFLEPCRALGYKPHFYLRIDQFGVHGDERGMLIIDGQPYSPAMPKALHNIPQPKFPKATVKEIEDYQKLVAKRRPYSIRLVDKVTDFTKDFNLACPASDCILQMRCPKKPASMGLPRTYPTAPSVQLGTNLPDICVKTHLFVEPEKLPYWQPYQYGSKTWYASMNRRNRVEGAFGRVKDSASGNLVRGSIRVMGLAKTALMTAIFVVAANLATAARAANAAAAGPAKVPAAKRGPRPRTRRIDQKRQEILTRGNRARELAGAPM